MRYDVIVVGGGHAGAEASAAAAKVVGGYGGRVGLFTISLDGIGNMPCNPSIGGTGKGQLVCEIDALGGLMGRLADEVMLQCRMLNLSKGPAVRSLRYQTDRKRYQTRMKQTLEGIENLDILQAEVTELVFGDGGTVCGVRTRSGDEFFACAVVIAAGTYLDSTIITGESHVKSGPDAMMYASSLSESLRGAGIELMRFKTGTPARIHADSIDYSALEPQPGDGEIVHFSHDTPDDFHKNFNQHKCYIAKTNGRTHEIIRANLHRAPMYSGKLHSTGARYCPSIEDKIVRFADKERHHIFVEPMGAQTKEMYLQGFSTSLPTDVQRELIRSLEGFEHARIMRYAYAIEYDCIDPRQLDHTLGFRDFAGLFGAGQFNGTSGYEEAAAQGLVAGVNAAVYAVNLNRGQEGAISADMDKSPEPGDKLPYLILGRDTSYIGMLIDDLVTKGTNEPYRVMTSRTEYRLLLRQDNAHERLTETAYRHGLVDAARLAAVRAESAAVEAELARAAALTVHPSSEVNAALASCGSSPIEYSTKYLELLRRPELDYSNTAEIDPARPVLPGKIFSRAIVKIHYEGYIKREEAEIAAKKKLESRRIPPDFDYGKYKGLSLEAAQKLAKYRPADIGEASRISGVSPADITVLLILLGG